MSLSCAPKGGDGSRGTIPKSDMQMKVLKKKWGKIKKMKISLLGGTQMEF